MIRRGARTFDVAIYAPWIAPLLTAGNGRVTGGAETQMLLLARALVRRGMRVCLIVFDDGLPLPAAVDGVVILARPANAGRQRLVGKPLEFAGVLRSVLAADADVVVARSAGPFVSFVGIAARLTGRRFVYSSASELDFLWERRLVKRLDRALFRLGLALAHDIVVQTEEQVALCRKRLGRSPHLIRSIAEAVVAGEAELPAYFVWAGRVYPNKRPLEFVQLARAVPEAEFVMVAVPVPGEETLLQLVVREAESLQNLRVMPPLERDELLELVGRAVAVVSTSEYEGMPNTFLEGWARGVPALTLSFDPDAVIDRHRIGVVAHGDRAALAAAARELWRDPAERSELSAAARRFVAERHDAATVAERWRSVVRAEPAAAHVAALES